MSFQYINPYFIPNNQNYIAQNSQNYAVQKNYGYIQSPYSVSFYNQNALYPYNPLYMPKLTSKYVPLGQTKAPNGETVYIFALNNGHKVAIMPRKDNATIVKTFLNGGSMNEVDSIRGISHCIEHFLFKGSSKYEDGDVFRLSAKMGASTNASTDYAKTDYYITAPYMDENNLAKIIEIQGDMISSPSFTNEAIEAEKGPVCSEISMINDDVSTIVLDKAVRNLFQIKSDSKNLVAGSIDTVQGLKRDDIINHHQTFYTPDNLYTVVVGDVDVEKTINLIADNFKIPKKSNQNIQRKEILTPITVPKREDFKSKKTKYTQLVSAFAGPRPDNYRDFVLCDMLMHYLLNFSTSNLKNELEDIDASASYGVQKVGLRKDDPYALLFLLALKPQDEQKGLDIFYDGIQKVQNELISNEDMRALKNAIKKSTAFSMTDSENLCNEIGMNFLDNSIDFMSQKMEYIENATPNDLAEVARKYLDLNKISIVLAHPSEVSNETIKQNYANSKYSMQNVNKPKNLVSFCGMKKITTSDIKEYNLQNNTRLAINNSNSDLCVFKWTINTPPIKPKNSNIPAVLEYMFTKGTDYKNSSELERYKELNGIDSSVFVNGKSIEISADCLVENIQKTLALLNELMYHPKLTQKDFDDAKAYVKNDLLLSDKNAKSNLLDKLYPGYFPTTSTRLKEIDSLSLDDIKEFYMEMLKNASSTCVATIPYEKYPQIMQSLINYQSINNVQFKEAAPKLSPIFTPNPKPSVICDTDNLNQAQIYQTYQFPLSGNIEDEIKFELLNTILGGTPNSRLFGDLREKQNLAYSVSSSVQSFENTGILTLRIGTTTDHKEQGVQEFDNVRKSLEGFKKHTNLLQKELVSDEELESAKMRLKQNLIEQCQNPMMETDLLAMNILEPYGIKRIDKYFEAIDSISKEDIKKTAKFIFSYNPTVSILASEDTINSQIKYLKTLGDVSFV